MTSIGQWAFNDCRGLKALSFSKESKLQVIKNCAFTKTALSYVTIPRGALVNEGAFDTHVKVSRE